VLFVKNETLEDYTLRDKLMQIEIYVVWKRGYKTDSKAEDLFLDWTKADSTK